MSKPKLCVLVGPTASGKSSAALRVAERAGMEIVSADSMQIYRGMDIGTAKATPQERLRVPHHMIDVCGVEENYTVARYREETLRVLEDIHSRGRVPLLVGGTGLYVSAVIDGLNFSKAEGGGEERARWEAYLQTHGAQALHAELARVDPQSAQRLHPNDTRRVVRALEVYTMTGTPMSQRAAFAPSPFDLRFAGLRMDRALLYERINKRVAQMMEEGLVEEARRVLACAGETARQGIGYRQLESYLAGEEDLAQAAEKICMETRRYAKRQMTWFLRDTRICWFEALDGQLFEKLYDFFMDSL